MTITKGVLIRKHEFRPVNVVGGLLLWILTAYILYAFFQLYREAFRILTSQLGDQALLILTPTENYLYNLFYGAIASALGFSIALRFTLQNSLNRHDWRTKSLIRRTLNTEGFYTWSFFLWFGKLGSMLGIWYLVSAMQYDLNLIREFPTMLLILPFVLFYSTWPNLSRLIRTKKMWWFLRLTGLFLLISFCFSFKNFIDYEKVNKNLLSHLVEYAFELKVPKSQSHQRIFRRSLITDIYIVNDTLETDVPVIFFGHLNNRVNIEDVQKAIAVEKNKLPFYEQYQLTANLHIDERILMKHIKQILDEFRKSDLIKIQYSTGRKYSRYRVDHPTFKYSGIQKRLLPKYHPDLKVFLDSIEQVDLKGKPFKLLESSFYRNNKLNGFNRIEISATSGFVTLNGQKIDSMELEQKVYSFIKKYSPNYLIIFNTSDEITYRKYIELLDMLWVQVDRLRNELSIEQYNQPFEYWFWEPEKKTIKQRYPRNILEWSIEEQRLNELMKKVDNKR